MHNVYKNKQKGSEMLPLFLFAIARIMPTIFFIICGNTSKNHANRCFVICMDQLAQ